MTQLKIDYMPTGERLIYESAAKWILCHPEDGVIIASWSESELPDTETDWIQETIRFEKGMDLEAKHLSPGLVDSIRACWPGSLPEGDA